MVCSNYSFHSNSARVPMSRFLSLVAAGRKTQTLNFVDDSFVVEA